MNRKTDCSCTDALHTRAHHIIPRLLTVGLLLTASWPGLAQVNLPINLGFREDRILVKAKVGADLLPLHTILGIQVLRTYPDMGNLQVIQLPVGSLVDPTIALYQQSGLVEYAERDLLVRALITPNDAAYSSNALWGLHNIGQFGGKPDGDIDAPEAWDILHDATDVIVAVIDTGIRVTHEDLATNMWVNPGESGPDSLGLDKRFNGKDDDANGYIDDVNGIDAINGLGRPIDDNGHGTHVAGTIGAVGNNAVGIVGVAWRVQLMACKFLNAVTDGSISDAIECIDYARSKGAKIINASWGWYGENSLALRDAIQRAGEAGIIFVAACGNSAINNDTNPLNPASFDLDNIVAVAATTRADQLADWSSYGATKVDLAAPGEDIFSCSHVTDISYKYLWGTSMAAPHVAGACALLWSRFPSDTHHQIIDRVLSTTDPLPSLAGKCVTGGRLNLQNALLAASDEPVITLSDFDPEAFEAGTNSGVILFHRTGDPTLAIEVSWTFSGTASNGSDFQQLPTTSPFPPGAEAYLTITPIDDTEFETNETVIVTLVDGPGYRVGSPNTATVTIADNDLPPPPPLPTVTVTATTATAAEPASTGIFAVSRSGSAASSLTVTYAMNGTAQNGTDYQTLSGSVTIAAGASLATIAVTPIDDTAVEGSEAAVLTISTNSAYTVGSLSSATVTITDNDQPPAPLVADFTASRLLGIVPLLVEFNDTSTGNPVSWNWNFGDGSTSTARNPSHIYLLPGTYTVTLTVRNSAGATSIKSKVIRATLF